jgi:hypothetical protein
MLHHAPLTHELTMHHHTFKAWSPNTVSLKHATKASAHPMGSCHIQSALPPTGSHPTCKPPLQKLSSTFAEPMVLVGMARVLGAGGVPPKLCL